MVAAGRRTRRKWFITGLLGAVLLGGCSTTAPVQAASAAATTPLANQTPTPGATTTGLSGAAWATQLCAKVQAVQAVMGQQSPGLPADPAGADVGKLQAWLAGRAAAQRDLAHTYAQPLTADFADATPWVQRGVDALNWKATFNENIRTKLASLSPQDAGTYWAQVADVLDARYDPAAAAAVVPSPTPTPAQLSEAGSRQADELAVYFGDPGSDCSMMLGDWAR